MSNLFDKIPGHKQSNYTAKDIEVLEGLEAVRKRPGMYIGSTDQEGLTQLFKEIFDNSMDEVISGYADEIHVTLLPDNYINVRDNGRGIPTDKHPKFPDKSALEVILTTLHSGGKFKEGSYNYSGGLHGVGVSVVNALSIDFQVEVCRSSKSWVQTYSKGLAKSTLKSISKGKISKGTSILFKPDPEIFGSLNYRAKKIYDIAKAKSYLYRGVKIYWNLEKDMADEADLPVEELFQYNQGIEEYIVDFFSEEDRVLPEIYSGNAENNLTLTKIEWAAIWSKENSSLQKTYCNTIETNLGGAHETGFKSGIFKALKKYAEILQIRKANIITSEDIFANCNYIISCLVREPQFQGQTKDKLVNQEVAKEVELMTKNHLEIWLSQNHKSANILIASVIENAEYRLSRRNSENVKRKNIHQKFTLPGKLLDCVNENREETEIFVLEGDSAAGSAKQARNSKTQAILPLRGKVLNVANNTEDKISANKELMDLELALGCGSLNQYSETNLRYGKVIIMTDADVDGAHIASLLLTFFFLRMPELIGKGRLYLACPPLYRITQNNISNYAQDEKHKEMLLKKLNEKKGKIEINRFKGLGEMNASQLKETSMDPSNRKLIKICFGKEVAKTSQLVNKLMGKNPELRFKFIQEQALLKIDCLKASLDL